MYEKLKSFLSDDAVFHTFLLILVGVVSFGLGRQSVESVQTEALSASGVVVTGAPASIQNTNEVAAVGKRVVVSKSGSKYHLLNCPGAQQIKDENKLFFDSPTLAEAAGYTPAANCEGI